MLKISADPVNLSWIFLPPRREERQVREFFIHLPYGLCLSAVPAQAGVFARDIPSLGWGSAALASLPARSRGFLPPESERDLPYERIFVDGLGDITRTAGSQCFFTIPFHGVGGYRDDRDIARGGVFL